MCRPASGEGHHSDWTVADSSVPISRLEFQSNSPGKILVDNHRRRPMLISRPDGEHQGRVLVENVVVEREGASK